MDDVAARFSPDYAEARRRFRAATKGRPGGSFDIRDDCSIDWAWAGDPDSPRVAVYSSGLHGVEGFPGGAAILETLAGEHPHATLYVHALNPWGMANLRRVNENNVDLNRNFMPPGQAYDGVDPAYVRLEGLLNPPSPPTFDFFLLRTAWIVATQGFQTLKNAVVSGQYRYPKGVFFGGAKLEDGPARMLELVDRELAGRERVVHVDWHSGLGKMGGRTLLLEGVATPEQVARVRGVFGPDVRTWTPDDREAYEIKGGMNAEIQRRLPKVRYDGLTCEFGTYPNLRVFQALRDENRLHHWSGASVEHPVKLALRETFSPSAPAWRAAVLRHAREVKAMVDRALDAD